MFVYINPLKSQETPADLQRFFQVGERPRVSSHATLVVLSALLLGGISKLLGLPLVACGLTVLVVALRGNQDPVSGPHVVVDRLSLAATAGFYLALGYCLGGFALAGLPLLWWGARQ